MIFMRFLINTSYNTDGCSFWVTDFALDIDFTVFPIQSQCTMDSKKCEVSGTQKQKHQKQKHQRKEHEQRSTRNDVKGTIPFSCLVNKTFTFALQIV